MQKVQLQQKGDCWMQNCVTLGNHWSVWGVRMTRAWVCACGVAGVTHVVLLWWQVRGRMLLGHLTSKHCCFCATITKNTDSATWCCPSKSRYKRLELVVGSEHVGSCHEWGICESYLMLFGVGQYGHIHIMSLLYWLKSITHQYWTQYFP